MQDGVRGSVQKVVNPRYQRGCPREFRPAPPNVPAVAFLTLNLADPAANRKCNFTVLLRPINGATFDS